MQKQRFTADDRKDCGTVSVVGVIPFTIRILQSDHHKRGDIRKTTRVKSSMIKVKLGDTHTSQRMLRECFFLEEYGKLIPFTKSSNMKYPDTAE